MESLRTAAEWAGDGDARNAEHHGALLSVLLYAAKRGCLPYQDGGAEAGVFRSGALPSRPKVCEGAGGGHYVEEVCHGAGRADRHETGALRARGGGSEKICGRHHLSFGGGS